ncbi:MAG TPA: fumarylacetoacetate hydrolase family protein [Kofleriaceae bacterium]|jgi:2-keto-4-pentenoate hydratase/2-oxohepta-3-ene-1,7-dioic acid hydratase in catechol pathway
MLVPLQRAGFVEAYDLIPSKIIGIGQNYRAHAAEMGKAIPEEPLMFMKPRSAMIPDGGAIERPPGYEKVDFEGELGVVIGQRARRVSKERALDYVLGYTIVNDVTVRDLQKKDVQYIRAKGFDSFCPIGPRIVPGLAPNNLRIQTRLNGVIKQDSSTSDMIFDVPTLIEFCSRYMTLEAGDVISTGTPAGVSNMTPGDVVEIEIEGIGVLRNTVIARSES